MTVNNGWKQKSISPLIFIAEDVPKNLQVLCNILRKESYRISAAGNGKQALEMIPEVKPDLVLLDVMMPEMNGFEVCEQMKEDPRLKDIPVIFLTAKAESADIVKGFDVGAVDYVTKPFTGAELLARVKIHLDLKFAREELKELITARDKFFSIIAHDLRNPIQFLLLSSDLLYNEYDVLNEEERKDYVQKFFNGTTRVSALLENLLEWSRTQRGLIECKPDNLDMGEMVTNSINLLQAHAKEKDISVVSLVKPGLIAFADRNMIRTVLRNLLSNAVKFTYSGGEVTVDASLTGGIIEIVVSDNGVGMSESELDGLFKFNTPGGTLGTAKEKGSGLGLLLCKEFIEKNNGTISVTSAPEQGSSFRITLPAKK